MKDFDLQKAIEGHKLVTRDGRDVTEFHYFKSDTGNYPCHAVIDGITEAFTKEGRYEIHAEYGFDLFLKSEKKKIWIPIPISELKDDKDKLIFYRQFITFYLDESKIDKEYKNENWKIVEVEIDI